MSRQSPAAPSSALTRVAVVLRQVGDWIARSPTIAFVVLSVTVMMAKGLSAYRILELQPQLEQFEQLLAVLFDLGMVLPVLLLLFVLPTARNLRRREAAESALRVARDELEVRVRERTAELEESNRRLREEADERRRAHRAVNFQAGLLDAVEQAVAATDHQGRIIYWNRFAEHLYGWQAGDVTGRLLGEVLAFRRSGGEAMDFSRVCGNGGSWTGEVEAERRDGTRFPAYLVCTCLPGQAEGYVCLSLDITASKEAEQALLDSEERYSTLVENSPTGIFILRDGHLAFVNPEFAALVERSRDELVGSGIAALLHPEERQREGSIGHSSATGAPLPDECECRLITRGGHERWVVIRLAALRNGRGTETLGTVQDVTDRKRMERELHHLSGRLLTIQEEERRRVARDLHDSVGQTLTGMKFIVEAALGPPWPNERRSGRERLRHLVPAIQEAVEEVRRISTELRPPILDDLGLLPTIAWYIRQMEKGHPKLAVEQQIQVSETLIPRALATPIYRLLQEATNNVGKHSGATRVTIGLAATDGRLRFSVADDGVGFDPSALPGEDGSGLTSMRERTELSGGLFCLTSVPGRGTTVAASWPL